MEGKVKLTEEQAKELTNYVEQAAAERLRNGAMKLDTDFYCGAMAVIHYLTEGRSSPDLTANIPPMWVLGLMSGRSPSLRHMGDEETQQRYTAKMVRTAALIDSREQMYEFVCNVFRGGGWYEAHARRILDDIGLYDFQSEEEE